VKLLIIRHGPAGDRDAWAAEGRDDRLRPLTPDGKKEMRQVAKGLRTLIPSIDLIATSPLVRAVQADEIVAKQYATESETLEALAPDHDPDEVLRWLREQRSQEVTAVIGHEPDLSTLASYLLTRNHASFLTLKKSGSCLLDLSDSPKAGSAILDWLLIPRVLRRLAD
jgi:phosphohistidine phosphatase